jgi:MEMO1 family protein
MMTGMDIRRPVVSGMFYPGDPLRLAAEVEGMLRDAPAAGLPGRARAIISPHAGYMYSGATAARAFAQLRHEKYSVVVVVAPSHRESFDGVSIFPGAAYETPMGMLPVHTALRERLLKEMPGAMASLRGHRDEHAIEVQLPFLQSTLGQFPLLPLMMGDQRRDLCLELGRALSIVLEKEDALLVASTDLSHYYPARVAEEIDRVVVDDVKRFDFEQLMQDLEGGRAEACGGGPTVAVMVAARRLGATGIRVLAHTNSGEVSGDRGNVVGYLSAVAYQEAAGGA